MREVVLDRLGRGDSEDAWVGFSNIAVGLTSLVISIATNTGYSPYLESYRNSGP